MFAFIKKIQKKSESTRKVVAMTITAILFTGIVLLWVRFGDPFFVVNSYENSESDTVESGLISEDILSPFESIKNTATDIFDNISEIGEVFKNKDSDSGKERGVKAGVGEDIGIDTPAADSSTTRMTTSSDEWPTSGAVEGDEDTSTVFDAIRNISTSTNDGVPPIE